MHKQALATLNAVRPAIARLDRSRSPDELATDVKEAWAGIETSLRSLLGGSPLSGQQLIREVRQRQMISFELANALAEFSAGNDRLADATYHVSDGDINAVREAFVKLEAALTVPEEAGRPTPVQGEAMSTKGLRLSPLGTPRPVPLPPERQPWWFLAAGAFVVVLLAGGAWWMLTSRGSALDAGIAAFESGRREAATSEFERVVRDDPKNVMAHVYLARIAREGSNGALAREHATLAVEAGPDNAIALREMGSVLLAARDYELARRFYVRAVAAAPDDADAQGWLGCSLIRLGRTDEGTRWIERAGQGAWTQCANPPTGRAP